MKIVTAYDPKLGHGRDVEVIDVAVMDTTTGVQLAWARIGVPVALVDVDDLTTESKSAGGRLRFSWLVEGTKARMLAQFCPRGRRTFVGVINKLVDRAAPPRWIAEQPRVEVVDTGALFDAARRA